MNATRGWWAAIRAVARHRRIGASVRERRGRLTEDPFHHGLGYGDSAAIARHPHQGGLEMARRSIENGISVLEKETTGAGINTASWARVTPATLAPSTATYAAP
ncbi:MAG: hypothetical protein R2856_36380 [Caldilineaceae bacterium]